MQEFFNQYTLQIAGVLAALGVFYPTIEKRLPGIKEALKGILTPKPPTPNTPTIPVVNHSEDAHDYVKWLINYFSCCKDEDGLRLSTAIGTHLYKKLEALELKNMTPNTEGENT